MLVANLLSGPFLGLFSVPFSMLLNRPPVPREEAALHGRSRGSSGARGGVHLVFFLFFCGSVLGSSWQFGLLLTL